MANPSEKLKAAVEDIVYNINSLKLSPHDAVVKTAREHKLNKNFIKRACEIVNVALHYNHFRKNPKNKDEDFPIVDAEKVAVEVLQPDLKSQGQKKAEWFPQDQTADATVNLSRLLTHPSYREAVRTIFKQAEEAKVERFNPTFSRLLDISYKYVWDLEKQADDLHSKVAGLKVDVLNKFCELSAEFLKDANYRTSFEEFETQAYNMYGKRAVPYLDLLYKSAGLKEGRGRYNKPYLQFTPCQEVKKFGAFLNAVDELLKTSREKNQCDAKLQKEKKKLSDIGKAVGIKEKAPKKKQPITSEDPVKDIADARAKGDEELDESLLTPKQKKLPFALKKIIIEKKKEALKKMGMNPFDTYKNVQEILSQEQSVSPTPTTTSESDNLDRILILQELMVTDPILSTVPKDQLINIYQQFLRIAPDLSREKEIVRSVLRQASAGQAISPYDAEQWMKANREYLTQFLLHTGRKGKD